MEINRTNETRDMKLLRTAYEVLRHFPENTELWHFNPYPGESAGPYITLSARTDELRQFADDFDLPIKVTRGPGVSDFCKNNTFERAEVVYDGLTIKTTVIV